MVQVYPYFIITKVQSGQLIKINKNKKFKTYSDCYDYAQRWFSLHPESHAINQFAIIEYVSQYEGKIITIFSNQTEIRII